MAEPTLEELEEQSLLLMKAAPLPNRQDNTKLTYQDIYGYATPQAMSYAVSNSPVLEAATRKEHGDEVTDQLLAYDWKSTLDFYNRPALDYDELLKIYNPSLVERQEEYDRDPTVYSSQYGAASRGSTSPELMPRPAQAGEEQGRRQAAAGFNPFEELKFENIGDRLNYRTDLALNPRNLSIEHAQFVGEKHKLKGTYKYLDPRKGAPEGLLFKPEGEDEYQLINNPYVTEEDIGKLLLNEVPALAGDILAVFYGPKGINKVLEKLPTSKRFPELMGKLGMTGNVFQKTGKVTALGGLAAMGATGGDALRLMIGNAKGANNLSMMEILEESALTGAFAFAGTTVVSGAATAFPALWKMITNKAIPTEWYQWIDDLLKQKKIVDEGGGVQSPFYYGTEVGAKEINSQIDELAELVGEQIPKYKPSIGSSLGTVEAADLEYLFLKNANNPELIRLYGELKRNNEDVIFQLVNKIGEKVGPKIGSQQTAADLAPEIQALARENIDKTIDEGFTAIEGLNLRLGKGADDIADTGHVLLNKVEARNATEIMKRTQTRINELRQEYLDTATKQYENALKNPEYADTLTGAGFTRVPARKWNNVTKKQTSELFNAGGSKEAKELFEELLGRDGGKTIRRLQGMNPKTGKFADGETIQFTLKELNDARVVLNDFASTVDNKIAKNLASDLELGIGKQMDQLVDEAAAKKSGFDVGSKELKAWRAEKNWGADLTEGWTTMYESIINSNTQVLRNIINTDQPEAIVQYILNTSTKGSKVNTPMDTLMRVLKDEGADETQAIQRGLVQYMRQTVFADDGRTAFQMAKDYRKFIDDHEGTLMSVFGDDFVKKFSGRRGLKRLSQQLEADDVVIKKIQARFGLSDTSEGQGLSDIMKAIVDTGKRGDTGGFLLKDIKYLMDIVEDSPELKLQISQVVKNELSENFLKIVPGTGGMKMLDAEALNKLLNEGWGTPGVSADALTFENFFRPLLGKQADDYLKFLRTIDEMAQKEIGKAPSEEALSMQALIGTEEYSYAKGSQFLMRMFIKPLTQAGRRASAMRNRLNRSSADLMGKMLIDEKFMKEMMRAAEMGASTRKWISILSAYGFVAADDMANTVEYYDPLTVSTPEKGNRTVSEQLLRELYSNPASAPIFTGALD